jgi:hypothetical protein
MSEKNQYSVIIYLKGFHEVELGQKIAGCEFGFEPENNQYFLSTVVTAESIEEAKRKGELRLNQVLSVFVIHTGITYPVSGIHVNQISGKKPFLYSSFMILGRTTYLPISKEKIEEIEKSIELFDKLPSQERSTKRVDKAINYFLRGCYLETQWRSESFLNFYKAIELISHDFRKNFGQTLINQLKDTLLRDLTEEEMQKPLTPKRLIQFACGQLGITDACDISKIVTLRSQFSAHARLKEVTVSPEDFNNCKILAGKTILKYADYIQTTKNA